MASFFILVQRGATAIEIEDFIDVLDIHIPIYGRYSSFLTPYTGWTLTQPSYSVGVWTEVFPAFQLRLSIQRAGLNVNFPKVCAIDHSPQTKTSNKDNLRLHHCCVIF